MNGGGRGWVEVSQRILTNSLTGGGGEGGGVNTEKMSSQQESIHQLELELTISQEKHRTCQKEVNCYWEGRGWIEVSQREVNCLVPVVKTNEAALILLNGIKKFKGIGLKSTSIF